jgi:hypothetical protein
MEIRVTWLIPVRMAHGYIQLQTWDARMASCVADGNFYGIAGGIADALPPHAPDGNC